MNNLRFFSEKKRDKVIFLHLLQKHQKKRKKSSNFGLIYRMYELFG